MAEFLMVVPPGWTELDRVQEFLELHSEQEILDNITATVQTEKDA